MAEKLVLLHILPSPFAAKVRIGLAEKGVEYESFEEDLSNKSQLLLTVNPIYKQIPVLIHNGIPISDSSIILEYIDEVWTENSHIFPSDPYLRANARFWVDYISKNIFERSRDFVVKSTGETQEAEKKELVKRYKVLEGELGNKTYFGGESFEAVDMALIPFSGWFLSYEKTGLNIKDECPKIVEWAERCLKRESVSKSLAPPQLIYEVLMNVRKQYFQDK
ncbi:glutathione S-transferase U19-like [Impatiens glandulifera]|uniref:glutathione S-transferase U19-like n=1 Tax=Impatiens glandulifera TaxID=253017 RepID=UPI001FB12C47|nr:glutathione S-transferase U19-like [Impatiens glandulifera]